MQNENLDKKDTISDILNESRKKEWIIIGGKKKWIRRCPSCNKEILYTRLSGKKRADRFNRICKECKDNLRLSHYIFDRKRICSMCHKDIFYKGKSQKVVGDKENRLCGSCARKEYYKKLHGDKYKDIYSKIINGEIVWVRKCPKCYKEIHYRGPQGKSVAIFRYNKKINCRSCASSLCSKGHVCSEETKKKLSKSNIGKKRSEETKKNLKNAWKTRPPITEKTRRKLRIAMVNRISKQIFMGGQVRPFFNPKACKLMDDYGKRCGYKFQHAMNGGEYHIKELGYFVDGYDTEKNIIFEYDENNQHHFDSDGNLTKKDMDRMTEIQNHLKCKFIRYNERLNEIKEY